MEPKDNAARNVPNQLLPFCFVKIVPRDADGKPGIDTIREAVRLFEEKDQLHLQISEKIRKKVFERERMLYELGDLKNYKLNSHNQNTAWKIDALKQLYLELDNLSVAKKPHQGRAIKLCKTEEEIDNKKLNYMMLHGSKNLSEEKQLLRNKNRRQKKTDDASSSPLLRSAQMKYAYNIRNTQICGDLKEINPFEVTKKKSAQLKESIRNQVKIICDELMEMRKRKQALETKIKQVDKQIEVINDEIWSCQKHLTDRNSRKDASLFMLKMTNKEYWVLRYSNLEYGSFYYNSMYLDRSSSRERIGGFHWIKY